MTILKVDRFIKRNFMLLPVVAVYGLLFLLDSIWRECCHRF